MNDDLPLRENAIPAVFPCEFSQYRLLKFLGQGWESCVFLAEFLDVTKKPHYMPATFAIKLGVDRSRLYSQDTGWSTLAELEEAFLQQHAAASIIQHPVVARVFSEVTPVERRKYEHVSEAGVLSIARLQEMLGLSKISKDAALGLEAFQAYEAYDAGVSKVRGTSLPFPLVKYLAAQLVTVMAFLHEEGEYWGDPTQNNIIVMADFTIRIIDMHTAKGVVDARKRDIEMLAGLLYNLTTGDPDFLLKEADWLSARFRERHAEHPLFYDMLKQLVDDCSCQAIRLAAFWRSNADAPGLDLTAIDRKDVFGVLTDVKVAAWESLDKGIQEALMKAGVKVEKSTYACAD